jgi:hypothetical protein
MNMVTSYSGAQPAELHPTELQLELVHAREPVSAAVAAHSSSCPQCSEFVRALERERAQLLASEPPAQFASRLQRAAARQASERWSLRKLRLGMVSSVTVAGTLAATVALAAIVAGRAAHWREASPADAEQRLGATAKQAARFAATGSSHAEDDAADVSPQPPPAGPVPRQLSMQAGNRLLAINPSLRPYRVHVPEELAARMGAGDKISPLLDICVTAQGSVQSVTIVTGSVPGVDAQLPAVLSRWRYRPYLVAGKPEPFCYRMRYSIQAK